MITKAPRGVEDWFKERMFHRSYIEGILRKKAGEYHAQEIITPVFEHTVLFTRGVGETTDIVQKEMYTFEDKGGRSLTLKPEGTAGVMRAFLENGMQEYPMPLKLYYVTPAFRYEKPQSGRLRQHHQFGLEMIGSSSPVAELEVISLAYRCLQALGIRNVTLNLNNIGTMECRSSYNEALKAFFSKHEAGLCPVCKDRLNKNPLRILDCKEESCRKIVPDAPQIEEYLDEDCNRHFDRLKSLLEHNNIPYVMNKQLVRGLDYYTKTVFEFVDEQGLTICGGGRYDNLIKEIDEKKDIPSVGFGMGIERLLEVIKRLEISLPGLPSPDLYIGHYGERAFLKAYELASGLRDLGYCVEVDCMNRSIKAQMKYANKINAKRVLILGEDELTGNKAKMKEMLTGEETEVTINLPSLEDVLG